MRPATPLDVSVYVGPRAVALSPDRMRAGLVLFNIANQSGRWERFSVLSRDGQLLAQTPAIADGGTAQLKARLGAAGYALGISGRRSGSTRSTYVRLEAAQPTRSGDSQLMQP